MPLLEIIGFILTIAGVLFASHQNSITWLISIVSPLLYIVVFYNSKLYADAFLQFFFIALSVYGLLSWRKEKLKLNHAVRKMNLNEIMLSLFSTIVLCACFYFFLKNYTNSDVPFADAFLTTLSLLATWLTAKKIIENWWIWIFADVLYAFLFFYKELYITSFLYLILAALAVYGLFKWKKQIQVV
jgi:nicotinamide mononucleotide transporter